MRFKVFSVDDHIIEPADVWTSRVPEKFRESSPRVIEEGDREFWVYEGQRGMTMGMNAVAGLPRAQWSSEPARFSDMIPGCYTPADRARDLLSQGVLASVSFPTLPRFGGLLFETFKDKALADVCVRAWNDFVLDEWCPAGPEGFYVPMIICQLWDPELAAEEIRRCAGRGARALAFPEHPSPAGLPGFHDDIWDPIWDASQETAMPVCLHIGSSGHNPSLDPGAGFIPLAALGHMNGMLALTDLVLSPVCRRFPELTFVFSEAGVGWIPAVLERCDRMAERHEWTGVDRSVKPSEIFQRNMYSCMVEEPIGLSLYGLIGPDRILAETDYPHSDSTYPFVQRALEDVFGGIPDEVVEMVTHENAERVFNWQMADASNLLRPDVVEWREELERDPHAAMKSRHRIEGVEHHEPIAESGRCSAMVMTGIALEPCGMPVDDNGLCTDGHRAGEYAVRR
jgi:predicted TIM-barrel fold metal-dependent hydrolase